MGKSEIFTIGHSNHSIEDFTAFLRKHGINCVVDVRSNPRSKYLPHFDKTALKDKLGEGKIQYIHFGEEFGARRSEAELYDVEDIVDFRKVRSSPKFKQGIERLREGIGKNFTIALMCAEADPLDCHRFAMVSYQLAREDFCVKHILKDGEIKTNDDLENELVDAYRANYKETPLLQNVMQNSDENDLEEAYLLKNKEIGFSPAKEEKRKLNNVA